MALGPHQFPFADPQVLMARQAPMALMERTGPMEQAEVALVRLERKALEVCRAFKASQDPKEFKAWPVLQEQRDQLG
jgi:hypothetical protein